MSVDLQAEDDLDRIAEIAVGLYERMLESPDRLYAELVGLCAQHPAKSAQVLMCMVAWFDPEVPCTQLWQRVEHLGRLVGREPS